MATTITPELETFLLQLIKQKKELSSIDDVYVQKILHESLKKLKSKIPEELTQKQLPKNKVVKELVTESRSRLREVYGVFKRKAFKVPKEFDEKGINKLLLAHQSSYERIDYYSEIYRQLFSILEDQGLSQKYSLLDLACGFNPLSYDQLLQTPKKILVGDLSTSDMELLQAYFHEKKFDAKAQYMDLLEEETIMKLSKQSFDMCFLFKALDSLEAIKRHSSKALLDALNVKFIVVSFALKSIGGKNSIGNNRRWWFEGFCKAQNWSFETFSVENELFYVVKK